MEQRLILDLDLSKSVAGELRLESRIWSSSNPGLARVGSWGGSALGVAILHAESGPAPLVFAVGSAVRRRLPTAARLSVLSRAPLTGRLAEGHIGGELGPNLSALGDALVLRGKTSLPGAVLTLGATGGARLESHPELLGCSPVEVWRRLRPRGALLSVGCGGELGLPYAVLAGGEEYPSFVGRGGLGAVFGSLGLKALVIEAPAAGDAPPPDERAEGLQRALASSPRLAARAAGGSLELYAHDGDAGLGGRLAREAKARGVERKGCRGCPTPCGWVFERADGLRQKGHFNANRALGAELGLESFDASLGLLGRCDEYGLDAREVGSMLALAIRHQETQGRSELFGDSEALVAAIQSMVHGGVQALGLPSDGFKYGSNALARRLGMSTERPHLRGRAAQAELGLAAQLGQAVSCGDADPMRSFPFLVEALGRAGLERICRDLAPLPEGAEDPHSPLAKGRLVAWHEDLVAAVDAFGFCVFSMAGLLADGVSGLDEIAAWLLPAELIEPGSDAWGALDLDRRLLAAGANIVSLRRDLDRRYRALPLAAGLADPQALSAELRASLEQPGMLDEYLARRGKPFSLASLALPVPQGPLPEPPAACSPLPGAAPDRETGSVTLQATGPLGQALGGGQLCLNLPLPASLREVLGAACVLDPRLAPQLFMGGSGARIPLPSAWRAERRLGDQDRVQAGDVLLLISVIAGG